MSKRLKELKAEREAVVAKLFLVRCSLSLLVVICFTIFVFEKPITVKLMVFSVIAVPFVLFCYDKFISKIIGTGRR